MPLVQLTAPPGVITDITDYQAQMRYTNADKVRFFQGYACLLYTSPSPRDATLSRMPSSA